MKRFNYFQLRQQIQDYQPWHSLTTGLTTGTVGVLFDLSFAALIFSGQLSQHLSVGLGSVLLSTAITRIIVACMSSLPMMVADLGTVPTAILAWSVGSIAKTLSPSATSIEILATVIAAIALTSLLNLV
jgi:SulP family sulfate permease